MPDEIGEETVGEGEGLADLVVITGDEQEDAETEDTEETEKPRTWRKKPRLKTTKPKP
jgi:hypothetical protein